MRFPIACPSLAFDLSPGLFLIKGFGGLGIALCSPVPNIKPLTHRIAHSLFVHRPYVPIPTDKANRRQAMTFLYIACFTAVVKRKNSKRLLDHIARTLGNEISDIARRIAHRGVFPIDKAHFIAAHKKIRAVKVVMAQHRLSRFCMHLGSNGANTRGEFLEIAGQRIINALQYLGDFDSLVIEVKAVRRNFAARMQGAPHFQSASNMVGIAVIQLGAPLDIKRYLPALIGILIEKRIVEAKVSSHAQSERLRLSIDDFSVPFPG